MFVVLIGPWRPLAPTLVQRFQFAREPFAISGDFIGHARRDRTSFLPRVLPVQGVSACGISDKRSWVDFSHG